MRRSLHSFWFHKSYKNCKSHKKEHKRTQHSFYKVKKELNVLFSIYIYIYILKKERNVLRSFAKERNVLAFFYVLCKRTLHYLRSLCSFPFFRKERKRTECSLGFISRQKLKKRIHNHY